MVESTALEMRHTGNRIVGSNPTLSAIAGTARPHRTSIRFRRYHAVTAQIAAPAASSELNNAGNISRGPES